MLPPTYQMRPLLCTWADTRPVAGESAGAMGSYVAGIWPSWAEAFGDPNSEFGKCVSGAGLGNWAWRVSGGLGQWATTGATGVTIPVALGSQLVVAADVLGEPGAIVPSRSLRADPVPVDIVDGGVQVTLGGLTYRNTYARRRQWVIDLLLDGALDVEAGAGNEPASAPELWQNFLTRADLGVTLFLCAAQWTTPGSLVSAFGVPWAYPGAPNRISGALVDATNLRWAPPKTGILSRYEATITIAEVDAPGVL